MLISQSEFARRIGKSRQYVNKMVKKGVIPVYDRKRVDYEEAKQILDDIADPHREKQRQKNEERRKKKVAPSIFDLEGKYESVKDMTEDERKKAVEKLKNLRAEAIDSGVDVVDAENSIEKMSIKELNLSILRQELRIKTAKADEAEKKVIPIEDVERVFFSAARVIRDGLMQIPARLAPRLAVAGDAHDCRLLLEEEIVRQLEHITEVLNEL